MPTFRDFPIEVVGIVLKNLDSTTSLKAALLTCRHTYKAYKEARGVEIAMMTNLAPSELIPLAVAVAVAERLPRTLAGSNGPRSAILEDLFSRPTTFLDRLKVLETTDIRSICRSMVNKHNVIDKWAVDFASTAWSHIAQNMPADQRALNLTSTEHTRICRAFYRVELWHHLFFPGYDVTSAKASWSEDNQFFFSTYPPWEIEQLGCVYQFLDLRLTEACRDVVEHDVICGSLEMSYYRLAPMNYGVAEENRYRWKTPVLLAGIGLLDCLSNSSYDVTKEILSTMWPPSLNGVLFDGVGFGLGASLTSSVLHLKLRTRYNQFSIRSMVGAELCDDEFLAMAPCSQYKEADKGPCLAWKYGVRNFRGNDKWITNAHHDLAWRREYAYVLWDLDRVARNREFRARRSQLAAAGLGWLGFSGSFADCYGEETPEYKDMCSTFSDRERVWKAGGSGYWAEGDESRVVWGGRRPENA